jgi:hypothetical protein
MSVRYDSPLFIDFEASGLLQLQGIVMIDWGEHVASSAAGAEVLADRPSPMVEVSANFK